MAIDLLVFSIQIISGRKKIVNFLFICIDILYRNCYIFIEV